MLLYLILQEKILEMIFIVNIKPTEQKLPKILAPQFEYIRRSVKAFNLPSIELINYEADDLIATYAKQIIKAGAKQQ